MDWSSITPAVVIALCSFVTAFCSFFIALFNYRRSNYSVVRVIKTSAGFGAAVGRGQYHEFKIAIQNLGIPLQNIGICLEYSPEMGFGWGTFPLNTTDGKTIRQGQFAKGAITEFKFATDMFEGNHDGFIRMLSDLKSQSAQLTLHADQYSMWSYRLHDRMWWLKRRWNRLAYWITRRFEREVLTPRGTKGIKHIIQVPKFESPGQNLLRFVEMVKSNPKMPSRSESKNPQHPQGQSPFFK